MMMNCFVKWLTGESATRRISNWNLNWRSLSWQAIGVPEAGFKLEHNLNSNSSKPNFKLLNDVFH